MRVPLSWLRELVDLPSDTSAREVGARLVRAGFEIEGVHAVGGDINGPLVIGRVESVEELTEFKKPIRHCMVDVSTEHGGVRSIICGATNFAAGDLVVVALPGTELPGGFRIASRETYGRLSDGMICSERELGMSDEHSGIMVLPEGSGVPGADAAAVLGIPDEVLDVSVNPDRGYAMSMRGIAREVATAFGVAWSDPGTRVPEVPQAATSDPHEGAVDDAAACDLLVLSTVAGVDPAAPSPLWMRRRLAMCGMRSVSLAVDVTNYVMLETGQPLHAFDRSLLQGPIVVRRARAGEVLETLDHVERTLDQDDLLITDASGPLSLAGVMGGLHSEVNDSSRDLVIEAAHFDAGAIARTSRRHRLGSEASRRFERGVDRMLAPFASMRAVELLLAHGGGTYAGAVGIEAAPPRTAITLDPALPAAIAGTALEPTEVRSSLEAVGCMVEVTSEDRWQVTTPSWRPDLLEPYDLVEEVVRLHGYDRLPATIPQAPSQRGLSHGQRLRRRVGLALAGAGYVEALQYPFIGTGDLDALMLDAQDERRRVARLANPLSEEQPFMRSTLLPGLLETLRRNISRGESDVALFEMGTVHLLRDGQGPTLGSDPVRPAVTARPSDDDVAALEALLPEEHRHVAVVLSGERERSGWWGSGRRASWADAIDAARTVADALGVPVEVARAVQPPWHPSRCAEVRLVTAHGHWVVGHAGELHPRVVEALGLPPRTAAMEIRLSDLMEAALDAVTAVPLSTMPVAKEDVALVVAMDVPAAEVEAALREGGGDLLEDVRLFDVYEGPQVGEGRRSLAFALRFRAPDRTLTDAEISQARQAAVDRAGQATGAVLRGS